MSNTLIIGYGNPLRGDDGFGWHAALQLSREPRDEQVQVLALHQLTLELAEPVSRARMVIFLDAREGDRPGEVSVERAGPVDASTALFTHHLTPSTLLACARVLYGACPESFLVTVCGSVFGYGERLSPAVLEALPQALSEARLLVAQSLAPAETAAR